MMGWSRRPRPVAWEIKVTTPDGIAAQVTTDGLADEWETGARSNDGYLEVVRVGAVRVWVKPAGHVEPDRSHLLAGTEAIPDGMRRRM